MVTSEICFVLSRHPEINDVIKTLVELSFYFFAIHQPVKVGRGMK